LPEEVGFLPSIRGIFLRCFFWPRRFFLLSGKKDLTSDGRKDLPSPFCASGSICSFLRVDAHQIRVIFSPIRVTSPEKEGGRESPRTLTEEILLMRRFFDFFDEERMLWMVQPPSPVTDPVASCGRRWCLRHKKAPQMLFRPRSVF